MHLATKSCYRWSLRCVGCGGSIESTAIGEVVSVRPGSWSMAEVWDGLPRNLRSPVLSVREKPEWGTPASKCPWPEKTTSGLTGARKRSTNRVREARKLEAKP